MVFTNLDTARYALDTICAEIMTDRTSTRKHFSSQTTYRPEHEINSTQIQ